MAKATATRKVTRKFLGRVGVDMGTLFICDPCYLPSLRNNPTNGAVESDNPCTRVHFPDKPKTTILYVSGRDNKTRYVLQSATPEGPCI